MKILAGMDTLDDSSLTIAKGVSAGHLPLPTRVITAGSPVLPFSELLVGEPGLGFGGAGSLPSRCRILGFHDGNASCLFVTIVTLVTPSQEAIVDTTRSVVISMRLPADSGNRLKRMASRHGWTPSDASARLVEEGLRRSEFAFIDFRDSAAGRQAYIQGSSLAVWEIVLLMRSYKGDVAAVARHLQWPEARVQAAVNCGEAFGDEIEEALSENSATSFTALRRLLPGTLKVSSKRGKKSRDAQITAR